MRKQAVAVLIALFLFVTVFSNYDAEAATTRTVQTVAVAKETLKKSSSTTSTTLATIKKGEYVTTISTKSGWSYVLYKGKKGYVKTGNLKKKSSSLKQVKNASGLKIYATASTSAKVYSTSKTNTLVTFYGTINSSWSFVQVGNVTGYALSKQLKTANYIDFYEGLAPIKPKRTLYSYQVETMDSFGAYTFDTFPAFGSKAAGDYSISMEDSNAPDADNMFVYYDYKEEFQFLLGLQQTIKVNYPVIEGNKKTYTVKDTMYVDGQPQQVSHKYTTTVKKVKTSYTVPNGKTYKNAVVIEATYTGFKGTYVFVLNEGLVYMQQSGGIFITLQ